MISDDYELDKAAHDARYEKIERERFENTSPADRPRAVLVGGQTGAGKGNLDSNIKQVFPEGNFVSVSTDELRDFHPRIDDIHKLDDKLYVDLTRADANAWQETLFDRCIETGRNIRFEGTLQNTQGTLERLQDLKDHGYLVTIQIVASHERFSTLGIYERYERGKIEHGHGRYVPQEFHDRSYRAIPETVRAIEEHNAADRIQIFDRSGNCIHDNAFEHGRWSNPGSTEALENERAREPTRDQLDLNLREWQERVLQPMRDRLAPLHEITQVTAIADRYGQELERRLNERELEEARSATLVLLDRSGNEHHIDSTSSPLELKTAEKECELSADEKKTIDLLKQSYQAAYVTINTVDRLGAKLAFDKNYNPNKLIDLALFPHKYGLSEPEQGKLSNWFDERRDVKIDALREQIKEYMSSVMAGVERQLFGSKEIIAEARNLPSIELEGKTFTPQSSVPDLRALDKALFEQVEREERQNQPHGPGWDTQVKSFAAHAWYCDARDKEIAPLMLNQAQKLDHILVHYHDGKNIQTVLYSKYDPPIDLILVADSVGRDEAWADWPSQIALSMWIDRLEREKEKEKELEASRAQNLDDRKPEQIEKQITSKEPAQDMDKDLEKGHAPAIAKTIDIANQHEHSQDKGGIQSVNATHAIETSTVADGPTTEDRSHGPEELDVENAVAFGPNGEPLDIAAYMAELDLQMNAVSDDLDLELDEDRDEYDYNT